MNKIALIPGSYDPITIGHYDIVMRALKLFDTVYLAVMENCEKRYLFTEEERVLLCKRAFGESSEYTSGRLKIMSCVGLLAGLYGDISADVMIKGVRNSSDFVYEYELSQINRSFFPDRKIETLFMPSGSEYMHISSTMVREMLKYGLDLASAVPCGAIEEMKRLYDLKLR